MSPVNEVAIVILNWNGKHFLEKFLPSVITHSTGARIIVADNASTDHSVDFLKNTYPSIEIIINDSNGGFAKGYNDALKFVDSKYYLLLNSDIEVTENWLSPLVDAMKDPQLAGCQPKVLSYQHQTMFEHAGAAGGYLDRNYFPFCRGRIFDKFELDEGQYNGETEIFWTTGAAMMIRAEIFHEVGGFDESFFAHMEEIDLCWRLKKRGYSFKAIPSSKIYHVGGGTLPYLSPQKTYLNFRNSLFMIVKNHDGNLFIKLFHRLVLDGIAGVRFLIIGKWKHLFSILRAHIDMYKQLSTLLQKRKQIKATTTHFNSTGIYNGSILWARYFKGVSKFSQLNQRLFIPK
ncbi:MAG: glycosyltransferase [Crocinitomicaceae bacterium]|nr:glycosyltransferase [Crocinitomicaceae bacterium]MCF8434490.1 glycosyltransferase [Crocinitomicaceae bacterium]